MPRSPKRRSSSMSSWESINRPNVNKLIRSINNFIMNEREDSVVLDKVYGRLEIILNILSKYSGGSPTTPDMVFRLSP